MPVKLPIPSGNTAKNIFYVTTDSQLTDEKPPTGLPGSGGTATLPKVRGEGIPLTKEAVGWLSIGYDADGDELFIAVWK